MCTPWNLLLLFDFTLSLRLVNVLYFVFYRRNTHVMLGFFSNGPQFTDRHIKNERVVQETTRFRVWTLICRLTQCAVYKRGKRCNAALKSN